ncbi:MAG: DUF2809 domain-containing protein [Flavobacterium sp.]
MLQFNINYFSLTIILFFTEVLIALFVHDAFVRPYIGDILVVILMFCFCKSFLNLPVFTVALAVLAFAFLIEILQGFNIVAKIGLEKSKLANVVLGNSFSWIDFLTYIVGFLIIIVTENRLAKKVR